MIKKLTTIGVTAAKPSDKRIEIADAGARGLYLVVQPSGAKSWALRYRRNGKPVKLTLGPILTLDKGEIEPKHVGIGDPLTLAGARKIAADVLHQIGRGTDPVAARKAVSGRDDGIETWLDAFVAKHVRVNNRVSMQKAVGRIIVRIKAEWSGRSVHDIRRTDVVALLDEVAVSAPVWANRFLACLRKFFNWMVSRDVIETSPCDRVERPTKEVSRDRVLTADELQATWRACDQLDDRGAAFIRLLIITGQRRGEVAGWLRSEIDRDVWALPGSRVKNGQAHRVFLSRQALEIIQSLPSGGDYIWGASPFWNFHRPKRALDAAVKLKTGSWTIHDLRRSVATRMVDLGVAPHVVEAILNHVKKGVSGIYNRSTYEPERRDAMQMWADKIGGTTRKPKRKTTGKVVPLRASV
jgi:site-specific recombinase XerD